MGAHRLVLPILAVLSSATVIAGAAALIRFDGTAGVAGRAPLLWPVNSKLTKASKRPQIVVFAHPKCSCTLNNLALALKTGQAAAVDAPVFGCGLFSSPKVAL